MCGGKKARQAKLAKRKVFSLKQGEKVVSSQQYINKQAKRRNDQQRKARNASIGSSNSKETQFMLGPKVGDQLMALHSNPTGLVAIVEEKTLQPRHMTQVLEDNYYSTPNELGMMMQETREQQNIIVQPYNRMTERSEVQEVHHLAEPYQQYEYYDYTPAGDSSTPYNTTLTPGTQSTSRAKWVYQV